MSVDLNSMAVFALVVEEQGFSAAARRLGLSKSAVSKHVAQLEDRIGARLPREFLVPRSVGDQLRGDGARHLADGALPVKVTPGEPLQVGSMSCAKPLVSIVHSFEASPLTTSLLATQPCARRPKPAWLYSKV